METFVKNGKLYNELNEVAVAVSYGFGAGWSTWNNVSPLDAEFNKLILDGNLKKAIKLANKKGFYASGLENCSIVWLKEGTQFKINEYDGAESIELKESDTWIEA